MSATSDQDGVAQIKRRLVSQSSEAAAGNLSTARGTLPPPPPQLPTRAVPPHRLVIGPNAVPWTRARVVCFSFIGLVSVVGVTTLLWFLVLRGSPHTESAGSPFERAQLVMLLEALVAYPTAPHQEHGIDQCLRFVSRYFQGSGMAGWFVRRGMAQQAPASKMTTLLLTTREKAFADPLHVKVLLLAHVDSGASSDPLLPRGPLRLLGDKGGRVYAPGVAYSKGPLAAFLYALRRLPRLELYDVALLISSDPPTRVRNAIEYTFEKHKLTADVAIVPDDGFGGFTIITEQKGALTLNLTVQSSSAPVSRPWEAPNPTHLLLQDLHAILQLPHKNSTREDAGGLALCENADGSRWHTTCSLSRLSSGSSDGPNSNANVNSVSVAHRHPSSATGILEVRFTDEWEPDELLRYIQSAVKHSQVTNVFSCPALKSTRSTAQGGSTHDYIAEARSVIEAEVGHEVPLGRAHSPSDARYTASRGIPTVIFGPKVGHTDSSEWLDVPSLVKYHHVVEKLIKKWGSIE